MTPVEKRVSAWCNHPDRLPLAVAEAVVEAMREAGPALHVWARDFVLAEQHACDEAEPMLVADLSHVVCRIDADHVSPYGVTDVAHRHADLLGVTTRTVMRMRKSPERRLSVLRADRYAGALGRHPSEIWPDWGSEYEPKEGVLV